ncbi:MAG: hypothetical protein K5664_02635 [Firmicutes bacterium]|nr:hypothetical protein [Bacillota bacterium]
MEKYHSKETSMLFDAILKLKDVQMCKNFFEDICTIKEIQDMSQRLQVAKELKNGKNYQEISKATGASTATISRVNKCLMYGNGGYDAVLADSEK